MADENYRVVLGEESVDWRGLPESQLKGVLDTLGDLLEPLADGQTAAIMDVAYDTECLPSRSLADVLYSPGGGLPPDERRRLQLLLDKCRTVSAGDEDIPQPVRCVGETDWREPSWGMSHALSQAATGRSMSCVIAGFGASAGSVPSGWPSGWLSVERLRNSRPDRQDLHILTERGEVPDFWRGVITRERVSESEFFRLAGTAFPSLLFADSLRFHHFKGSHMDVLPWLVGFLSLLNDHFVETLALCGGDQKQVQARFKVMNADISPESSNTKKNAKAWEERNVLFRGQRYRCEWHGKRLWDRDRVHFSLPIPAYGGRVLVGIFTGHLST
ncbi:hypothetical protein [Streptomyces pakalii]|uniref:Uncharacterized protein n=1 Tax=Streptomyces pakalii TaxID=3036494 RepID=A0ABT7D1M1_9ACTN|nr:hypothetical protein [Streptomyces pakalii]MDJ1639702.1 hypothetical protein [Streptomyces pakalii]